ncbi:hypothetical protein [Thermobifida cellulosilytica]|uniref:DUF1440 domain-containing protein n=1 Tax=Thermobifida cellulosilytica TB100 TaxID=665004 RepID=A0A147KJT3_THECS|nr:hypothetical protein [Thermobifida cellulosilytica]KUP97556.1 hypothetical protein AC529_06295 [Thermobifida cellulosilytica TB100]
MGVVAAAAQGAAAGAAATAAMTGVMAAARKQGGVGRLPPKLLTRRFLPGGGEHTPRPGENLATTAAHWGFGSAAGAVFGLLTGGRRPRVALGLAYGAAVWLVSYEGWVPKLTVQPPAHRDAPGRAATMAAAHLVYGGVLAAVLRRMRRDVCPRGGRSAAQ